MSSNAPELSMKVLTPDEEPEDRWCASGHVAPSTFKRDGPGAVALPTRFIRIAGQGTFCEPCVCVANYLAARKRKEAKRAQD